MARYWKITDSFLKEKASVLYDKIKEGSKKNKQFWTENVAFEWEQYYGGTGFNQCVEVYAVVPKEPFSAGWNVPKGWKISKRYSNALEPDLRYREGKAFDKAQQEARVQIGYHTILEELGIKHPGYRRFTIPKLYNIKGELFFIGDEQIELEEDSRFEEVTLSYIRQLEK